mmetsp:Transcript_45985/g.100412  ORF Transcript_45985/g.100412 Transcript_45985/m.100412 type:complete len:243 (-) Transcript_45985:54-782(-)
MGGEPALRMVRQQGGSRRVLLVLLLLVRRRLLLLVQRLLVGPAEPCGVRLLPAGVRVELDGLCHGRRLLPGRAALRRRALHLHAQVVAGCVRRPGNARTSRRQAADRHHVCRVQHPDLQGSQCRPAALRPPRGPGRRAAGLQPATKTDLGEGHRDGGPRLREGHAQLRPREAKPPGEGEGAEGPRLPLLHPLRGAELGGPCGRRCLPGSSGTNTPRLVERDVCGRARPRAADADEFVHLRCR